MSRSGYSEDVDDQWALIRWRGAVASAMRGSRGQAFLTEMLAAMDAMPVKRLIAHELACSDGVCAIGTVGQARGVDMSKLDPEDYESVAAAFGINTKLAQEVVYMNDEYWHWSTDDNGQLLKDENGGWRKITPEERFQKMRKWIVRQIKSQSSTPTGSAS